MTVTVEWARPRPPIKSYCKRCRKTPYGEHDTSYEVVSPTGIAHMGEENGNTACGIDATGDKWWWRL